MITNPAAVARLLATILDTRGPGHTGLMRVGIDNYRGDAIVVGLNNQHALQVTAHRRVNRDMFKTYSVGIDDLPRAAGLSAATAVDHAALSALLHALVAENMQLRAAMAPYESETAKLARLNHS